MLGFNRLMTNNAEILWKPGHNYSAVFHSLKQGLAIFFTVAFNKEYRID